MVTYKQLTEINTMNAKQSSVERTPPVHDNPLEVARQEFVSALISQKLITPEYRDSGALERFYLDTRTGIDALSHILVGDTAGGFHHLHTAESLGLTRRIGSWIANPDPSMSSVPYDEMYASLREKQRTRPSGVYFAKMVGIGTGSIDPATGDEQMQLKAGGSNMFPNSWSTQEVLEAITMAVDQGEQRPAREPDIWIYSHTVNDVQIQVFTTLDDKILVAYPRKV